MSNESGSTAAVLDGARRMGEVLKAWGISVADLAPLPAVDPEPIAPDDWTDDLHDHVWTGDDE